MFFWNGLILSTSFDGQFLAGQYGNDQLTSTHNMTGLVGLDGDDHIATTLSYAPDFLEDIYAYQSGGTGNDTMTVSISGFTNYIGTLLDGGAGADRISVNNALGASDPRYLTMVETFVLADKGNDVVDVRSTLTNNLGEIITEVYAGGGADVVNLYAEIVDGTGASTAYNYAEGNAGDDVLTAWVGGSATGDILGNELWGGAGNDTLTATVEADVEGGSYLYGGRGADTLTVIGGNYNELYAGAGRDTLIGSTATDYMVGGAGADTFVFGLDGGADIIADFVVGSDALQLADSQSIGSLSNAGGNTTVNFADGSTVVLEGLTVTDPSLLFA